MQEVNDTEFLLTGVASTPGSTEISCVVAAERMTYCCYCGTKSSTGITTAAQSIFGILLIFFDGILYYFLK